MTKPTMKPTISERLASTARTWLTSLRHFVFPTHCPSCGSRLMPGESVVCAACFSQLELTGFDPCGPNDMERMFWGQFAIVHAHSFIYYTKEAPAAHIIRAIKYHDRPELGRTLARQFALQLQETPFFDHIETIVPVPISRKRMRSRGYNQSEWIAKGLADATGIPLRTDVLRRIDEGNSQTKISPLLRKENVNGAFVATPQASTLSGRRVLIVDDVMTTGSTLTACAQALEASGTSGISIFTLTISSKLPHSHFFLDDLDLAPFCS